MSYKLAIYVHIYVEQILADDLFVLWQFSYYLGMYIADVECTTDQQS